MMTDLEQFVNQPGRPDAVDAVTRRIADEGITYLYFQFVSVTGRVMGKGIPAAHWASVAANHTARCYGLHRAAMQDYRPKAGSIV